MTFIAIKKAKNLFVEVMVTLTDLNVSYNGGLVICKRIFLLRTMLRVNVSCLLLHSGENMVFKRTYVNDVHRFLRSMVIN